MHPILVLWATPRSTSTAFEWVMRMRGDLTCFHEPFGEARYKGDEARWPRIAGLTFDSVWQALRNAAAARQVFCKDFPHYVRHLWSDAFLDRFDHNILISDPARVVTSMFRHWPDFVPGQICISELFDRPGRRGYRAQVARAGRKTHESCRN